MKQAESFNIVFFGSSHFVIPILESLRNAHGKLLGEVAKQQWYGMLEENEPAAIHPTFFTLLTKDSKEKKVIWDNDMLKRPIKLIGVVTQPDSIVRNKTVSNPVAEYAKKYNIPLFQPESINKKYHDFIRFAKKLSLGIVASYGQIVSEEVIDSADNGFINWHPSRLPEYRGPTPIQSAIADGKQETALSWIDMTKEMDAGDIYLLIDKKIKPHDTFTSMSKKLGDLGSHTWALVSAVKHLEEINFTLETPVLTNFAPARQDFSLATYTKKILKETQLIDFRTQSAEYIYNHYRAYNEYPGTWFRSDYFGQQVKLVSLEGWYSDEEFKVINKQSTVVRKQLSWYQLKVNGIYRSFIKCAPGYLEVKTICLKNGKTIDLSGFEF